MAFATLSPFLKLQAAFRYFLQDTTGRTSFYRGCSAEDTVAWMYKTMMNSYFLSVGT